MNKDEWSKRVGEVFKTNPRVGIEDPMWMPREDESTLASSVHYGGVHICLDGPSGAGKTSLARTVLESVKRTDSNFRYLYTRVGSTSTWDSFKRQIVSYSNEASNDGVGFKIGIKDLLPYVELSGTAFNSRLKKRTPSAEVMEALNEPELAKYLVDKDLILVVDDSDLAKDELLLHLTEVAKEITDSFATSQAKIFFIGSDNILKRIFELKRPLIDRVNHVTIGTVKFPSEGWRHIVNGFTELGLSNPGSDKYILKKKGELEECKKLVHMASDGLPKSITKLGLEIAEEGYGRGRISASDIKSKSIYRLQTNFRYFRRQYKEFDHMVRTDRYLREVLIWFYQKGIGQVFKYQDLSSAVSKRVPLIHLEEALDTLVDMNFLVRTGSDDEVLFMREPLLAHTFGAAVASPLIAGVTEDYFDGFAKQLMLDLTWA